MEQTIKNTIEKIINASKQLQEIYVKGQDTLRMATALTLIEQSVQELAAIDFEANKPEEKDGD